MQMIPTMPKEDNVKHTPILIVARPTRVRDGLEVLLRTRSEIEVIDCIDDPSSALRMVIERPPALMILNTNLPNNQVWTVLKQVKAEWPQIRCLVLTDDARQKQTAEVAGADAVLLNGFKMAELFAVIETFSNEDLNFCKHL